MRPVIASRIKVHLEFIIASYNGGSFARTFLSPLQLYAQAKVLVCQDGNQA